MLRRHVSLLQRPPPQITTLQSLHLTCIDLAAGGHKTRPYALRSMIAWDSLQPESNAYHVHQGVEAGPRAGLP